jgi:hypothetical protein
MVADCLVDDLPGCKGRVVVDGKRVRRVQAAREAMIQAGYLYRYRGHFAAGHKVAKYALRFLAVLELRRAIRRPEVTIEAVERHSKAEIVARHPSDFDADGRALPAVVAQVLLDAETQAAIVASALIQGERVSTLMAQLIACGWIDASEAAFGLPPALPLIQRQLGYHLDQRAIRRFRADIGQPPVRIVPDDSVAAAEPTDWSGYWADLDVSMSG